LCPVTENASHINTRQLERKTPFSDMVFVDDILCLNLVCTNTFVILDKTEKENIISVLGMVEGFIGKHKK